MSKRFEAYNKRNETLRDLGFDSYADYLNSGRYRRIKTIVMVKACKCCVACKKQANQIHHTSYDRDVLIGRDITKCLAICGECHENIEFDKNGTKLPLIAANRKLYQRAKLLNGNLDAIIKACGAPTETHKSKSKKKKKKDQRSRREKAEIIKYAKQHRPSKRKGLCKLCGRRYSGRIPAKCCGNFVVKQ